MNRIKRVALRTSWQDLLDPAWFEAMNDAFIKRCGQLALEWMARKEATRKRKRTRKRVLRK